MTRNEDWRLEVPPDLSLSRYFLEDNLAAGRADKTAVLCGERIYTFNDLCVLTNKVGNVLKELGVCLGDRVLLVLQDRPEWLASWFATMKIGGVTSHVYTYLPPEDYAYFIGYVEPRVVIVDATTLDQVRAGLRQARHPAILLVAGENLPPLGADEYGFDSMVADASGALDPVLPNAKSVAFWNFSGGTTGKPKGVPHAHSHAPIGCMSFQQIINFTPDDVVLRVPKLFFHYARDLGMNYPLRWGAAVCLSPERTTPELVFKLIAKYRPTVLLNVPTMMRAMLQSPEARNADFTSLRVCLSSGELLSAQLYTEFTQKFGVEVINVHGSAESYLGFFVSPPDAARPGSSGKIAPLVEVKLVDGQGGEVAPGDSGVLWVRSGASGSYYHGEPEKSANTFLGDGWVNTNDLFREDEDGYFWYTGRADDLIKVSGVYVAPLEVENCLARHIAVSECAVLGVKDADGLIKTKAFVVLKQGIEPSERIGTELDVFCRQHIAGYKAPRFIEFLPELPKTGQGKIDKRQLLMRGVGQHEKSHALTTV